MGSSESKRARSPEAPRDENRKVIVRVWLLGGFRVSVGSRTIPQDAWRLRKAAALVKLLALAPGHRTPRERAMNLLWPDSGRKAASNNLRQVVYGARKVLDPSSGSRESYLGIMDEQIVLCPEGQLWVDVDAFEQAASVARRSKDPSTYRAAIELYAGELLPEDRYEEWAETRREELRRLYLTLTVELASLYEGRGEYAQAIEALRKATAEEQTLEEAHASLMRLHALSGRPERALAQYERLRSTLSEELSTEPSLASRRLRDEIAAGRLPTAPPANSARGEPSDAAKHNLPAPRTSLVGREREMVEVKRALAMTRLLTLTGAGGSGKTRLSLEVTRGLVGSYHDGVWFVELAPLSEPELLAQEVAGTLRVQERPGEPLVDTLADVLAGKELLLVLDNCEHLVEAAARLVDVLLASCPNLRVLATSREPLGVSGEVTWVVPPLSLPDATNGGSDADVLMRYEAVRLFVDRARLRLVDFEVTRENAGAVARVCRKLDGIPLAIELATARIGALAVEQVAQRLESSLDVLKGTSRTAAPRQQTLRATLDWSYDLLTEPERAVFRRLSVFAGGWTLEAAEAVCSGDGIEQEDVLDLLGGLLDKSLIVAGTSADDAVRYGMLEPIRQYAEEKLEQRGEVDEMKGYHGTFYLALAEEAEAKWQGSEEFIWLGFLETEHDNLRAALSQALDAEPELALQLAAALWWFWEVRGHFGEGQRWLELALAQDEATAAPAARAGALSGLGVFIAEQEGDFGRAEEYHEAANALYEELGDQKRVADSLVQLGWALMQKGDVARAVVVFEKSLAAARESSNLRRIPGALDGLACIAFESEDFERAQRLWEKALALAQEQGSALGASNTLLNMGYAKLARGDHKQATALLEEASTLSRRLEDKRNMEFSLMALGIAATLGGEPERAETLLRESLAMALELGSQADVAEHLEGMAEAVGALGEDARGARLWGAAEALRETLGFPWGRTEQLVHEPQLMAARSRVDEAIWQTAFAEGQAMTFEEAVEYALAEQMSATPASPAPDRPTAVERYSSLSAREREVAALVARGLSNRQIAQELFLSERTIEKHVSKILRKLDLNSRTEIASWATQRRLQAPNLD